MSERMANFLTNLVRFSVCFLSPSLYGSKQSSTKQQLIESTGICFKTWYLIALVLLANHVRKNGIWNVHSIHTTLHAKHYTCFYLCSQNTSSAVTFFSHVLRMISRINTWKYYIGTVQPSVIEVEGISLLVLHFNVTNYRFVFPLIITTRSNRWF